jgi:tetratricopeptide (TPR) repeat protein
VPASDFYRLLDEAMDAQGKGDLSAALANWQKSLELDPLDARANNGMGIALGMSGKPDDAILYFQKAVQAQPDFFEAYYNLGAIYSKGSRLPEAVEAWKNVVRIRPNFAQGHEKLGYAFYTQAKFSDALTQFHLSLDEEPNRLFALKLAANLLATCPDASVRNGAEAVTLAERARKLSEGKDTSVLDTLSAAYAESGNFAQATEVEQQALALATEQGDAAQAARFKSHLARYASHEPLREAPSRGAF